MILTDYDRDSSSGVCTTQMNRVSTHSGPVPITAACASVHSTNDSCFPADSAMLTSTSSSQSMLPNTPRTFWGHSQYSCTTQKTDCPVSWDVSLSSSTSGVRSGCFLTEPVVTNTTAGTSTTNSTDEHFWQREPESTHFPQPFHCVHRHHHHFWHHSHCPHYQMHQVVLENFSIDFGGPAPSVR